MTTKQERPTSTTVLNGKPSRRTSGLGLAGMVALALMALALGWLFWFQTQRSASASPEALIAQAAEVYRQSGDVAQAQAQLAGLEVDRLAQLFAQMEADAPDEVTRQYLAALREALGLPLVTLSLWDSLRNQKWLLISLALAALPLLGALVVSLLPAIRRPAAPEVVVQEAEVAAAVAAPTEAVVSKEPPSNGPKPAVVPTPPVPQDAQPAASAPPTPPQADASSPAADPKMQDILSSVFESETSAIKYEVLLNELEDIQASDLLAIGKRVIQQFQALSASPNE